MKTLVAALAVLLSVASLGAQQKFSSLPIGANLEGYINSLQIWYGPLGSTINGEFDYRRQRDGPLETFAIAKLREMSLQFVPEAGQENARHAWAMYAVTDGIGGLLPTYNGEAKPATIAVAPPAGESTGFYPVEGEIPEEVFKKVRFQFGAAPGYYIPGVTDLEINLYQGSRISRFSTRERVSDLDNPCSLAATILALPDNVGIPNEIATAKPSWWERAEITLYTANERFVTFVVNRTLDDGKAIRWSNPPPSFFVPPTPKIASLKRVGYTTELVVEGTPDASVTVEWSAQLNGEWQPLNALVVPLALSANGKGVLTHTPHQAPQVSTACAFQKSEKNNQTTRAKMDEIV